MTTPSRRLPVGAALLIASSLLSASPAAATQWTLTAQSTSGADYQTDLDSISVEGRLVRSLSREVLPHPRTDERTGKPYVYTDSERFDDCAGHQVTLGAYVRRDEQGRAVSSGSSLRMGQQKLVPGTIGESVSRTVCAIASPPKDEAIPVKDGPWTDLGASADGKFHLEVLLDHVVKADHGVVFLISRSIYAKPEWINGFAIREIVIGSAIDCAGGRSGSLATDFYVAPNARVMSLRPTKAEFKLEKAKPGSFLAQSLKLICAAAVPDGEAGGARSGWSAGTAWGVNKGYLVTASHVIEGGARIYVYDNGEKVGEARVVADDPANDLAILRLVRAKRGKITILPIAPRAADLGRSIFVLGYPAPDALGQRIKMTAGEVSSTAGYQDDARYLQISVPVQEGNSGGPVIAWDGSVVGVVEAKLTRFGDRTDDPPPEMVNYALKAAYIRPMLEGLPDLGNYSVVEPVPDHESMVAAARKAVFMLLVAPQEDAEAP